MVPYSTIILVAVFSPDSRNARYVIRCITHQRFHVDKFRRGNSILFLYVFCVIVSTSVLPCFVFGIRIFTCSVASCSVSLSPDMMATSIPFSSQMREIVPSRSSASRPACSIISMFMACRTSLITGPAALVLLPLAFWFPYKSATSHAGVGSMHIKCHGQRIPASSSSRILEHDVQKPINSVRMKPL